MALVVLFKSESDGPDKYVELLEANNFEVKPISCLSFQFKNIDLLLEKLRSPDDYGGLIFTSPRAVFGVQKAVELHPYILCPWVEKENYSVGERTFELSQKLLNLQTKGKESGNAEQLSSLIISDKRDKIPASKPFLFPSGNLKQDTLEKSLKKSSINVTSVELYETVEDPKMEKSIRELKALHVDFMVYFSPSGIKFTLPLLRKHDINLTSIKIIAIGPSSKKALEEKGLECFHSCKEPTPQSLLETLYNCKVKQ